MKITFVHPCIGRRADQEYIRTWQMEPLSMAALAGLTPKEIEIRFYDDRMESVPYDEPTDLVALSVETYTAKRAYQIASEYRRRRIPVVMGGFHATLCPEEVARYAEAVVVGEAEDLWPRVVDDARHGTLQKFYRRTGRSSPERRRMDRSIFGGRRYLPIRLVETSRGCRFRCEFCAVQAAFSGTQTRMPVDAVLRDIASIANRRDLFFFVDDNITANPEEAKAFFRALGPFGIQWVSQCSIDAAHDEELLALMKSSGCVGVLVGFESLNTENLRSMNKGFNIAAGGFAKAIENFHRHRIRIYSTFVFGYDADTPASFAGTVAFAREQAFTLAAFNHLVPFPGTPLYQRLAKEGRLIYDAWWLDDQYDFNTVSFQPKGMTPEELRRGCLEARRLFYSWPSILRRGIHPVNRGCGFVFRKFLPLNVIHRHEVGRRDHYPLGDSSWKGPLLVAS